MARDVGEWLDGLGLGEHAEAFARNKLELDHLPDLSEDDLKDLGVAAMGDRKTLLRAIAAIAEPTDGKAEGEAVRTKPASRRAAEAERRQLTVMFVDLVGSTALSRALDPEDLREVMRRYQDAVAGSVGRYEGYVAKFLGDGVLAYFGWPQAHEEQADRAVRAGLETIAAVGAVTIAGGEGLAARVGIATGLVVIGDMVGEATAESGAVIGETPNLAARLQDAAAPGTVVVGQATRRLIGAAFELQDLGAQALKGFSEPMPVWQVVRERPTESRFDAAHAGGLTTFIGREHEFGLLSDRWRQAKSGEGQVVLISGEAGIGKSRITNMLRKQVSDEPHARLHLQCSPYYTSTAFYPFIGQLERAAAFEPDDSPSTRLDKLERLLGRSTDAVGDVAPLFAALLSVPAGERYPPLGLPPERQKALTLAALTDQMLGLAARQPVLVMFEDAHWIDPTSLEALERIVDRADGVRVLVVITHRPEFVPPWRGHSHVTALTLNRLSREQSAGLVATMTGDKALPDEVLDQIVAKTDGVPLFVEELTKTVLESGLLRDAGDRYELSGPLPPLAIPSTLQDSLMARLDRLAPVKEIAQIGAVIGREFGHRLLAAVSPLGDNELHAALAQLVEAELIFRRGAGQDASYIFKHALVQDAAYTSLLMSTRQALHKRLAEALKRDFADAVESEPETLARHFTAAGLNADAATYWLKAGSRAAQTSANAEAMEHFNKGIDLTLLLPESPERDARERDLWITKLNPLFAAKGYSTPEAAEAIARALELCRRTGDTTRIFPVLYGRFGYHYVIGEIDQCRVLTKEFLQLVLQQESPIPRAVGHRIFGTTALVNGDTAAACTHLEKALAVFDSEADGALAFDYGQDVGAAIYAYLALSQCLLGRPDQAAASGRAAIARARQAEHANSLGYTLWHAGAWLCWLLDDRTGLIDSVEQLVAHCDEHDLPVWRATLKMFRARTLMQAGSPEAGLAELDTAKTDLAAIQFGLFAPTLHLFRAEMLQSIGSTDDAARQIDEALIVTQASGETWLEPELHRLRGRLHKGVGKDSDAELEFSTALDIARRHGAKWFELRAATDLAGHFRDRGEISRAREILAPVHGWFTEGFDTPDLKAAKRLLGELA